MHLKTGHWITALAITVFLGGSVQHASAKIIRVPADFETIALAVQNASSGDTILLSPGNYNEQNIDITKPLTVSSEWIVTGEQASIDNTIIDASGNILFSVTSDDVEISGLTILNGDHTLDINGRVTIKYNHLDNNLDPISMESGGGGYVGYNLIENNGDDGIDLDISVGGSISGSDILIEYNTITNSDDDGIEIRLFDNPNQNIHYEIRHNAISESQKAGIQLISYDVFTGKVFDIHHNIIRTSKAGIGCMEGSNTDEDLSGASMMDEEVYLYNNTFIENEMGATGGNRMIAINNIVADNWGGGFKLFGGQSAIVNNIFYSNNSDLTEISSSAEKGDNLFDEDPLLDAVTFIPGTNSPCIDAGIVNFTKDEIMVIEIGTEDYLGLAPDIGALESGGGPAIVPFNVASNHRYIINYPNPFKLKTTFAVNLVRTGHLKVDLFDLTGRKIETLDAGIREKGVHTLEWSARDENGNKLPGGIYIVRINEGGMTGSIKMSLLE